MTRQLLAKTVNCTGIQRSINGWRIALLALLSIAASQLVLAGHQFAHDETLVAESCAVCIQLEQLDVPVAAGKSASLSQSIEVFRPPFGDQQTAIGVVRHYASRAPPIF